MHGLTMINLYWDAFFLKGFLFIKFLCHCCVSCFHFFFLYLFNFINLCKLLLKKLIRLLASSFPKFWISTSSFCLSYTVHIVSVLISTFYLGCTNAAKRLPHPRLTREGRCCLRVCATSSFFYLFIIFFFVSRLMPTRAELGWSVPIRAELVLIDGSHRYPRQLIDSSRNWKKKKKGVKCTIWPK